MFMILRWRRPPRLITSKITEKKKEEELLADRHHTLALETSNYERKVSDGRGWMTLT